ncbi:DUF1566 domain-containing protein [Sulfurimonas sp. NWX79]
MIKTIFFTLFILYFSACVLSQKPASIIIEGKPIKEPPFTYMFVTTDQNPFKKGERVKVYGLQNGIAKTSKGNIEHSKLEKERSEFQLFIESPNATRIRILNIKPKYKNGIWLKAGKYHIELTAPKHYTHKGWITLKEDRHLSIALKRKKNISQGYIYWHEIKSVKYINGAFWQDMVKNKQSQMNWKSAEKYCKKLSVFVNRDITLNEFRLPTEQELLELRKYNSYLDYSGTIYWSSTIDKQHPQFAKYVYINKDKSGWYDKNGKTYVRCISRKNYPTELSLHQLVKYLTKHEHYKYREAYEFAVDLKYGKPIIKHVVKRNDHKIEFTLRSQKYDKDKNYFYYKNHTVKESKKIIRDPDIKFEIINDKLVFREIK